MPTSKSSLIHLTDFTKNKVESLFKKSLQLKKKSQSKSETIAVSGGKTAALLFFEASTRTRFSFEAASVRAGYHPLILDSGVGTSLEKGETVFDTIRNIEAMRPLFFVIRCDDKFDLQKLSEMISVPIINAGWGLKGHPTQALLDAMTLFEKWETLANKKVLFVGDVRHSRVVASHMQLASCLNYQIGFCGPEEFAPLENSQQHFITFKNLGEGLQWADAVMALRVQKERHDGTVFNTKSYHQNFGLNSENIKKLSAKAFIMHPGPINYGIEMEENILQDARSLILQQAENGVFLRQAIIQDLFKEAN